MTIPITPTTPYGQSYMPPPPAAQPTALPTTQGPDAGAAKEPVDNSAKVWGKDGFTFGSVLATINPLQHIPVVGSIYRAVTGDEIGPAPRMIGDALYGGVAGLIVSAVDVAVEAVTGKDIGANVASLFKGDAPGDTKLAAKDGTPTTGIPTDAAAAPAPVAQATPPADPAAAQIADASNPTAGIDSVIAAALPPPSPIAAKPPQPAQQIAAATSTLDKPASNNDTASSAVGTGAKSLPSAVAPPPPVPDVMSTNMRHAPKQQYYAMHGSGSGRAGLTSYDPTLFEPRPAAPTSGSAAPVAASKSSGGSSSSGSGNGGSSLAPASPPAEASTNSPAADPDNNWFSQAMSRGLDKYSQIQSGPPASPQVDIAR